MPSPRPDPRPPGRLVDGIVRGAVPVLGTGAGLAIAPDPVPRPASASTALDDIGRTWDPGRFAVPRQPVPVGSVELSGGQPVGVGPGGLLVADMPVKFPGSGYRLPAELGWLAPTVALCAGIEATIASDVDEYFAYLTVHRSLVPAGAYQRGAGVHSDGVQGRRRCPKTVAEHGYTASDLAPTRFYPPGFDLTGLDPARHWLNAHFEAQADDGASVAFPAGTLVLFDAYCVHAPTPAPAAGLRTFFRLLYSVWRFDRLGNTRNALFDYDWAFAPRPVPADLRGLPAAGRP